MEETIIIGLTGQSGAGKTMLCAFISQMQIAIVNCDALAKEVLQTNPLCKEHIKATFPNVALHADNSINRQALASIVFQDSVELNRLNAVIFPYIITRIQQEILILMQLNPRAIILDAPTLFESGADILCNCTIGIIAKKQTRIQRIMQRDHLSFMQATQRINAQHDDNYYKKRCDYILCNYHDAPSFLENAKILCNKILSGKFGLHNF